MIDTFENVDPKKLAADTAIMAVLAWQLADAPEPFGRRLSPSEAAALLEKSGVAGTKAMVYAGSPR